LIEQHFSAKEKLAAVPYRLERNKKAGLLGPAFFSSAH